MKIFKAFNIDYDTDGNKSIAKTLPKELFFEVTDPDFDPHTEIADLVSDQTGWCIFGCETEDVTNEGVMISGNFVSFAELQADVNVAFNKGFKNQFAFTPETIQALLTFIRRTVY